MTKDNNNFVDEWQRVSDRWEALHAQQSNLQSKLLSSSPNTESHDGLNAQLAEVSAQLAETKREMDAIIQAARAKRTGRFETADSFVVAELGPNMIVGDSAVAGKADSTSKRRR